METTTEAATTTATTPEAGKATAEEAKPNGRKIVEPIPPSEAARILARARDRVPGTKGKPAKEAAPVKAETPKVETKPDADEEAAKRLADLVKGDKALRAQSAKLAADRKAFEIEQARDLAVLQAMRDARTKGDRVAILKAAFPDEQVDDIFWDLVKNMKGDGGDEPAAALTTETIARVVEDKIAAAKEADQKAAQEADTQKLDAARRMYTEACSQELEANLDKFPLVNAYGFSDVNMEKHVRDFRRKERRVPEPLEVLQHFEDRKRGRLKGTRYEPREEAPPAKPGATVSSNWTRDSGASPPPAEKPKTLEERREELKGRLRAMFRKAP